MMCLLCRILSRRIKLYVDYLGLKLKVSHSRPFHVSDMTMWNPFIKNPNIQYLLWKYPDTKFWEWIRIWASPKTSGSGNRPLDFWTCPIQLGMEFRLDQQLNQTYFSGRCACLGFVPWWGMKWKNDLWFRYRVSRYSISVHLVTFKKNTSWLQTI